MLINSQTKSFPARGTSSGRSNSINQELKPTYSAQKQTTTCFTALTLELISDAAHS